ncbi:MAG: inositol monophosphatase [Pseudolabrys sp.]|nr:inositol monophosphatase [Pseudolabrys sp.]
MSTTAKAKKPEAKSETKSDAGVEAPKTIALKDVEKLPAPNEDVGLSRETLREIESAAIELAGIAGAEITRAVGGLLAVRYKTSAKADEFKDPVSEVDQNVEIMIRKKLSESFPKHDIIGEESKERPAKNDFIWAVDPIDGTANFVNGLPLFAASIGILYKGVPVVGAVWTSVSHALRAGVYHCTAGGKLRFDGADVTPKVNPDVKRRLIGVPVATVSDGLWETRKTGSAALECAMVAAGLLQAARFATPNIWDIAGGLALVFAGGGVAWRRVDKEWVEMTIFEPSKENPDLRYWRGEIIIGERSAAEKMVEMQSSTS